jgi:hypothetical protein
VSPARKPPPKRTADSPKTDPRKPLPEELARDAIAHEEEAAEGKVRMTFRVVLARPYAEALAARAIREEKNIGTVVTEILEGAVRENRPLLVGTGAAGVGVARWWKRRRAAI